MSCFRSGSLRYGLLFPLLVAVLQPSSSMACVACYGQSDDPLAQGMNWAILTLLVITLSVLAAVAAFFVYLAKRAAALRPGAGAELEANPLPSAAK